MAAFRRGPFFVPSLMQCRHRGKINVKRPKISHPERRIFEAITQPVLLEKLEDPNALCNRINKLAEVTQEKKDYEAFLKRRCLEMMENHSLIVPCQILSHDMNTQRDIKNKLFDHGFYLKRCSKNIMRQVLEGSKWTHLSPIISDKTLYVVNKEIKLNELVKVLKKIPQLIILGGVVGDRLMTHADIMHYASIPNIETVHAELVRILSSGAAKTASLLGSHQQTLTANLDQYLRDKTEGSEPPS